MTEIVVSEKYRVKFCLDRAGNMHAVACIPTPYGVLRLTACYPLREAAKVLQKYLASRGVKIQRTDTGGFFSKLKNLTAKIARAKALAPVIASVQAIQKNPVLARAVGLTTAVIPGLGSATAAIKTASSLVQKAMKGDVKSLASLKTLKSLALMGNPAAKQAFSVAQQVFRNVQAAKPVDMLRGLAAPVVQQIQAVASLPGQVLQVKDQILSYLPPQLRGVASLALQQVPGVSALQGAAQAARSVVSGLELDPTVAGLIAPLAELNDPGGAPYAAGAYYGC
jgi:hypothetical protein